MAIDSNEFLCLKPRKIAGDQLAHRANLRRQFLMARIERETTSVLRSLAPATCSTLSAISGHSMQSARKSLRAINSSSEGSRPPDEILKMRTRPLKTI